MPEPDMSPYQSQLFERRQKLESALASYPDDRQLRGLLDEVDAALTRLAEGRYGLCMVCEDPIEPERLIANPLEQYCLDHLTPHQQQALEEDLELARQIQSALLPPPSYHRDGWTVSYHYEGAGPVSGDYCDLLTDEDDNFYFLVGDVAGKGIAASMLMAHLHATFRALVSQRLALNAVVERASRIFCESSLSTHFATLVAGKASTSGEVELCNAGHVPPLIVKSSEIGHIDATGLPLGMFCDGQFSLHRTRLAAGDLIVLQTDGISEARNSRDEEYGTERLTEIVREHRDQSPGELISTCMKDLRAYRTNLEGPDDITMMVIRRLD